MRPAGVVPLDPLCDSRLGLKEAAKIVLPSAFLLEAAKEPFDDPVLLGRVRFNELLTQAVIPAGCTESTTLENKPVVASDYRCASCWPKGTKSSDAV